MEKISFSDGIGVAGLVLALVLVALDKSGKLKGPLPLVLLALAALMTVPVAISLPWISQPHSDLGLLVRRIFMVTIVAFLFSGLAVWITNDESLNSTKTEAGPTSPIRPSFTETARPDQEHSGTIPTINVPEKHLPSHTRRAPPQKLTPPITITGVNVISPMEVGKKVSLNILLRNNTDSALEIKSLSVTAIQPYYEDPLQKKSLEDQLWAIIEEKNGTQVPFMLPSRTESLAFTSETVPLTVDLMAEIQSGTKVAYFLVQLQDKNGAVLIDFCGHTNKDGRFDYCRYHNGP